MRFARVRCWACMGKSAAVDADQPLTGILTAASSHVRDRHPAASPNILEVEMGHPAIGWDTDPGSPSSWANRVFPPDF